MKKIIVLLGFSFFAFAGTASAGGAGGCHYEKELQASTPLVESETPTDPKLLALLKKKEAESRDVAEPVFN